ncbi:sensor histidine kinase [Xanthocytophaga agilis]|uniref:Histidine kinase n=1 Tax=Xanthocytophaga agilis TaxID=3048010 RepID=A0AAE3QXQ0_9BACT|nr:histidine kinase [Xanthocytophaga agilis]MDJ1499385.1 histidine kinase [Xanthocytophaga agilis]
MNSRLKHIISKLPFRRLPKHQQNATVHNTIPVTQKEGLRWHVLLMPMVFIPLVSYWLVGPAYFSDGKIFLQASLLNYFLTGCCVLTLDTLTQKVIRQYPGLDQSAARAGRTFLVFFLVTPSYLVVGIFIYSYFHLFGFQHTPGLTTRILLYNVGFNILSVGIDETVYSLRKWRENALEREELEKVTLQSQYESLKHQVNPHFLFNSLNSLSSLIADEPQQAEHFVDEMAKVYRYLLQTNNGQEGNGELTTLATELDFIESYFHLLKTRYRAGIELQIEIDREYMTYRLPPLALQMLVENAVKHNVISNRKPLLLELFIQQDQAATNLLIRNNLQRKIGATIHLPDSNRDTSNGVGLTNITAKYRLLNRNKAGAGKPGITEPAILCDDHYFTVVLPLFLP